MVTGPASRSKTDNEYRVSRAETDMNFAAGGGRQVGRLLQGGLRLCGCGVNSRREQQAGAHLNAKFFHGFALLTLTEQ
jgi:hypothetical protein